MASLSDQKCLYSVLFLLCTLFPCANALFGPKYPLTAAFFQDRYTQIEWNKTLSHFADQGGDTVMLRAPSVVVLDKDDIQFQPDFKWCKDCASDAYTELQALGLTPLVFATYTYEENYEERTIMACPLYDKKIVSARIYYRLVLPLNVSRLRTPCDLNGTDVMVLFTSFAGIDPHDVLLRSANQHNMSVYFGLPDFPDYLDRMNYGTPHLELMRRLILDHHFRFSNASRGSFNGSLYDVVKGYTWASEFYLTAVIDDSFFFEVFLSNVSRLTGTVNKQLVVCPSMQLNRIENGGPTGKIINGFERLARLVDVVAVKDGRAFGRGGYFWSTQNYSVIADVDKILDVILHAQYPSMKPNITYNETFIASVHEMFDRLSQSQDALHNVGVKVDLWLNIEAFHNLRDDPCLPVDKAGSGLSQMVDRVTKAEIDWALTAAGPTVQKVTSLAYDPSFTCVTRQHASSLGNQIKSDFGRPIIAKCFFHSRANQSVVVIGYNLLGETQGFTVEYTDVDNKRQTCNDVHGYYFEADWGNEHGKIGSLIYTQLYDCYNVAEVKDHGTVRVSAGGGTHACSFVYDFRNYETSGYGNAGNVSESKGSSVNPDDNRTAVRH